MLKRVPLEDRAKLASGLGRLAASISPENPLEGAKRLFVRAGFESKWAKRKRLIRLPGEEASEPGDYGTYEATGPMWVSLAGAAAKLLNPHAEEQVLAREQDRLLRQVALGTSFHPQQFVIPGDASPASELLAELASALTFRIGKETGLLEFWNLFKTSPFQLRRAFPETSVSADQLALAAPLVALHWGEAASGFFSGNAGHSVDWALPTVRIGVLQKHLNGRIFIPPPYIRDALRDPFDWNDEGDGLNQQRVAAWLAEEGVTDQDYNPDLDFGWTVMTMTTTQSVFLQACHRPGGEMGLWLKVNETFLDNFIPRIPGVDLIERAYEALPPSTYGAEPFDVVEDEGIFPGLGILSWPHWCRDLVGSEAAWRSGLIGVYSHVDTLAVEGFSGEPRTPRMTAEPPNIISGEFEPWLDVPEGVGGWIDDTENRELMSAVFANPPGFTFRSLIAQDPEVEAPCRAGTIGEALLRNIAGSASERLDEIMIQQASTIVEAGTRFHQARVEDYRAKVRGLLVHEARIDK